MAAGAGLTAAADLSIVNTITGAASGTYVLPTAGVMWLALFTTQFTAAAKAGATEWSAASDTAYVRVSLGTAGTRTTGWTIAAYASGTGVVFNNFAQVTQPAVAGTAQTLFALGFCLSSTPGTVDMQLFTDLSSSTGVGLTIQVILLAATGAVFTAY